MAVDPRTDKANPGACAECGKEPTTHHYCLAHGREIDAMLDARSETAPLDVRVIPSLRLLRSELIANDLHAWAGWLVAVLRILGDTETPLTGGVAEVDR